MTFRNIAELSLEEFRERAARLVGATEEEAERLFPMARDLLERAEYINSFAPEYGEQIDEGALSETIDGAAD